MIMIYSEKLKYIDDFNFKELCNNLQTVCLIKCIYFVKINMIIFK